MKPSLILAILLSSIAVRAEVSLRYYYLSPAAETYTPLTEDRIKQAAFHVGELKGRSAEYFLGIAQHATRDAKFDPNTVRLLIETSDGRTNIYIDRYAVAKSQGAEYSVNPIIFSELEKGLDMLICPTRDIPYEDWRKIRTLREEIPKKLLEDKHGSQWLNFTCGMGAGTLIILFALFIRRRRKPGKSSNS
jgi:hypothetical protein